MDWETGGPKSQGVGIKICGNIIEQAEISLTSKTWTEQTLWNV